jgi:hypothetical protein
VADLKSILSLGAGVQSSTLALMAATGEVSGYPHLDAAIFADTQAEPDSVYRWLDWLEAEIVRSPFPFPVHRVTAGDLGAVAVTVRTSKNGNRYTKAAPPAWAINTGGKASPIMRQCTQQFKIEVIQREIRRLAGKSQTEQWIGISLGESHRMNPSRNARVVNRWPLLDLRMRRADCLRWMERRGYPRPPRSACVFCPYQSDREWARLKAEEPASFARAVAFESAFDTAMAACGFAGGVYLHPSMRPLDSVDFVPDRRQADLWGNECEGMCGV